LPHPVQQIVLIQVDTTVTTARGPQNKLSNELASA